MQELKIRPIKSNLPNIELNNCKEKGSEEILQFTFLRMFNLLINYPNQMN
jgi:hypothetical protein